LGVAKDNADLLRALAKYLDTFEASRDGKVGDPEMIAQLLDNRGKSGWKKSGKVIVSSEKKVA
jgi:hypothetical protein